MTAIIDREGVPVESIDPTVPEVVMESGEIVDATTVPWYFNGGAARFGAIMDHQKHRPRYTDQHVHELATHMYRKGVPYCFLCHDWHELSGPYSQHSMSEADLYDPHEGPLP